MKTALLVIDVQKVYTNPGSELFCPDSTATLDRINALIGRFQETGDPIVYVRHVHNPDGTDLGRMFDFSGGWSGEFNFKEGAEEVEHDYRLIISPANALEITKTRYSCFANTKLSTELEGRGIDSVVVCGFMTNFCCESTARDAHDRDYYVDFIVDATGNPGLPAMDEVTVRNAVGTFMQAGFARVTTARDFLSHRTSA